MALVLQATAQDRTKCTEILITNTTGDYNALTNPGGFGAPNPTLASLTTSILTTTYPDGTIITTDLFALPYEFPQTYSQLLFTPAANGATAVGSGILAATNATPIVVTTNAAHGLSDTDEILIVNALGNTAANGYWNITVLSSTTFSLTGSVGNGTYTSGGLVYQNTSEVTSQPDGVYKFVWEVSDGATTYSTTLYHLHQCALASCLARLSFSINMQKCCSEEKQFEFANLQSIVDQANYAFGQYQYTHAEELIERATALCEVYGCNCGGC